MGMEGLTQESKSRRSILVAAASAVGVLTLAPIRSADRVLAVDPNDVVLGANNTETTSTKVTSTGDFQDAIVGVGGPGAAGIFGSSVTFVDGDAGANDFTVGVRGDSPSWTGVLGTSVEGRGVVGRGRIGVEAAGDIGVSANGDTLGVDAGTLSGTAIRATSFGNGTALRVIGPARFSTSGLATIKAGNSSVTVNPNVNVTTSSKVFATLQTTAGGTIAVRRIARQTSTNRIVIYLTSPAHRACTVAWFLISRLCPEP